MLHTTRGIVLRTFKHGDGSNVLKAYTEAFGARTYMVRTGKRGGAPTVRRWLVEAGIAIRSRAEGGSRRRLEPPTRRELTTLTKQGLSLPQIARRLGVSRSTARRW